MGHHEQVLKVLREKFGLAPLSGVEIGTAAGDLTLCLLMYIPNIESLYTIDPWQYREGAEFEASQPQEHHNYVKDTAYRRLWEFRKRVTILEMGSDAAAVLLKQGEFDFVWIDGDHTESQVKRDLENFEPLIRKGGLIGGHDFGQVEGVTKQVRERYGDRIKTGDDFTWWVEL